MKENVLLTTSLLAPLLTYRLEERLIQIDHVAHSYQFDKNSYEKVYCLRHGTIMKTSHKINKRLISTTLFYRTTIGVGLIVARPL